jgi:predicted transglutaminase-like cysteine proteinase
MVPPTRDDIMQNNKFNLFISLVIIFAACLAGQASAKQLFMPIGGYTSQPIGHYEFCQRLPADCAIRTAHPRALELTRSMWKTLVDVNNHVNTTIIPKTDMDVWGQEEYWGYPVKGEGDCDDIVLEKRRLLLERGIPASDLLITVVRLPNGEGHAILTVATDLGDFILDNLEPQILLWTNTDYEFLKRQSELHTGRWVSIKERPDEYVGSVK